LARQPQVSRKFLDQQANTAAHALTQAFDPAPAADDVLFDLLVTGEAVPEIPAAALASFRRAGASGWVRFGGQVKDGCWLRFGATAGPSAE
jgi:hypothetical protein